MNFFIKKINNFTEIYKIIALFVCKGYWLKCAIITLRSNLDLTLNCALLLVSSTEPTLKKVLIEFNNSKSLLKLY